MKRAGFSLEARTAPEMVKGGRMVAWELDAAEALAGLARCSASRGGDAISGELKRQLVTHSQDKTMATKITASPEEIKKIIKNIPNQSCGRNFLSNSVSKSRPKLTEGEKQERKARRIMANREAARETVRRRQAMFLELNKKAADVSDENENLKKEKELAVEEYNALKCRNELLKAKLAKSKKPGAEDHMQVDPKASRAENICSWPNHPSMVPCFWPPIFPLSDAFKFQCAASHSQETGPSHFPMFLYPMPWLLPFFAHGHTPHSQCGMWPSSFEGNGHLSKAATSSSKKSRATELTSPSESGGVENTARYPDGTIYVPELFNRVKPQGKPGPTRKDVGANPGPTRKDVGAQQFYKETEDTYAATEARKRRKELMKMKNVPTRHHANMS